MGINQPEVTGDEWTAADATAIIDETNNVITTSGQVVTTNRSQMAKSQAVYATAGDVYVEGGGSAADVYVFESLDNLEEVPLLKDGQRFRCRITNTNTGASTANVNGLGAKAIEFDGNALVGGELLLADLITLIYNLSNDKLELIQQISKGFFVDPSTGDVGLGKTNPQSQIDTTLEFPSPSDTYIGHNYTFNNSISNSVITGKLINLTKNDNGSGNSRSIDIIHARQKTSGSSSDTHIAVNANVSGVTGGASTASNQTYIGIRGLARGNSAQGETGATTFGGDFLALESNIQIGVQSDTSGTTSTHSCYRGTANGALVHNLRSDGVTLNDSGTYSSPADYAEMFQTEDGKSIETGITVTLVEGKIKPAASGDDVIGVVRAKGTSTLVGNTAWNNWIDKYDKTIFGEYKLDKEGKKILSEKYDESKEYIPREKRKEWVIVGLLGQVEIKDDQEFDKRWIKMNKINSSIHKWFIR